MAEDMQERGKMVADVIRKSFLENMHLMSNYKRSHLAIRLFRATGSTEHNSHIIDNFNHAKKDILSDLENYKDEEHIQRRAEVFFANLTRNNDRKAVERQKVFKCRKKDLFYLKMIELLHIWDSMGLLSERSAEYAEWKEFLGKSDIKSKMLDDDVFRHFSAQLVNFAYQLKFNNVMDITGEFRKKFDEVFGDDSRLDDYMYRNKIYTMTHFIIAASDYYQGFVSADEFRWILDYFSENMEQILKRTNADIVAEVGLCFRLCRIDSGAEIDSATEYLLREFDAEKGYIPRMAGDHESSEHANSVAYMFLKGFDTLHKGPYFHNI